jgi:hypothetical protein
MDEIVIINECCRDFQIYKPINELVINGLNNHIINPFCIKKLIIKGKNNYIYCNQRTGMIKTVIINGKNNKIKLSNNQNNIKFKIKGKFNEIENNYYNFNDSQLYYNSNINNDDESDDSSDEDEIYNEQIRLRFQRNNRRANTFVHHNRRNINLLNNENKNNDLNNKFKLLKEINYKQSEKKLKEINEICSICEEKFNDEDKIIIFNCNCHFFHINCIKKWVCEYEKKFCPNCRKLL